MAIYRIYPEKDTFIFSETNTAGLYGNAGKDEILEIGGYPDAFLDGQTNRTLIQFATKDINYALKTLVAGPYSASLHMYLATGQELPQDFSIYGYPISSSWESGFGHRYDAPINLTGATWKYRDSQGNAWTALGGDFITSSGITSLESTKRFTLTSTYDLDLDLTTAIDLMESGSLTNNGFLLKLQDSLENNTTASVNLKYFGADSNTIFPPYLEFKWDDSIYSSSLPTLSTDVATVSIKNNKGSYTENDTVRFRLSARPKYPTRTFTTSSIYLTEYKLPVDSYWGIKDEFGGEMIVDFDTNFTKISADSNGSYFDVIMDTFQPERFYRLLIKTTVNGSNIVVDNQNVFKVVRHV